MWQVLFQAGESGRQGEHGGTVGNIRASGYELVPNAAEAH